MPWDWGRPSGCFPFVAQVVAGDIVVEGMWAGLVMGHLRFNIGDEVISHGLDFVEASPPRLTALT